MSEQAIVVADVAGFFWLCVATLHDWLKNSRHFFNQSEVNPTLNVTGLHAFSRASRQPRVFTSSFDWFTGLSVCFVIGQR